jgi:hypothetical protein
MKKAVFGCLGVAVVLGVAGAFGVYFFVYKPTRAYLTEYTKLKEIPQLHAQVSNQTAFTPPANQELTSDRVTRFLGVQQGIQAHLGARVAELDTKYKQIEARLKSQGGEPSVREGLEALKDLVNLIIEAKRAQVNALNAAGFSVAEYDWTRRAICVGHSSGLHVRTGDPRHREQQNPGLRIGDDHRRNSRAGNESRARCAAFETTHGKRGIGIFRSVMRTHSPRKS